MSVVATGAQSFARRFPGKRRGFDEDLPQISPWRCNLTGLSHKHNLYFVAYSADIYVYAPRFPTQTIPEQPELIFSSPPSRDGLRGHIDPDEPHAINNLVVQDFGTEEIVAVVRDDGDVDAYYVRHIVQAIASRSEPDNTLGLVAHEVRNFFQNNVGRSAWGLAIHKHARIIAVSSNNHDVQIFKFALHVEHAADDEEDDARPAYRDRDRNITHHVVNGDSNIPYISFCNTGDDPDARWLLTTDISGFCRVIDLHNMRNVQAFRFGPSAISRYTGGFDRLNAGWALMFLDRRSFLSQDSVQAALGLPPDDKYSDLLPGIRDDTGIWDLSKTVSHVPDVSSAFLRPMGPRQRPDTARATSDALVAQREDSNTATQADADNGQETQVTQSGHEVEAGEEENYDQNDNDENDENNNGASDGWETEPDETDESVYPTQLPDANDDSEDEGTEDTVSFNAIYSGRRICGNKPQFMNQTPLCDDLPCPILHASIRNIYLLQPCNRRHHPPPFSPPMVGLANPLEQEVEANARGLNMFERLNMNAYIPALGIVVLASQKGRAIVLQLTKLSPSVRYPPELQEHGFRTNYAMRVQAILPFAHQEAAGQRPFSPLHGIATGPVQGTEKLALDDKKRWRLMLMYQDHSILSYEICRDRGSATVVEEHIVV